MQGELTHWGISTWLVTVYKKFSDKAGVMTVFTVLTGGGIAPIFIFAIRNNELRE